MVGCCSQRLAGLRGRLLAGVKQVEQGTTRLKAADRIAV
jgi:hypothetical protein